MEVSHYTALVLRSGLVDRKKLVPVLRELENESTERLSTKSVSTRLIDRGLITGWQHNLLLRGRWRGFLVGNYKLLDHLGAGGMCRVFLAEHRQLGRQLAMKMLTSHATKDGIQVERFYREARCLGRLNHPNIVTLHDVGVDQGRHYMALEYIKGTDLQQIVDKQGPLPCRLVAEYIAQVADAVNSMHREDLVHRDIKPSNIIVNEHGKTTLLDMGLVRDFSDANSLTVAGQVDLLGTVDYIAPEQIEDSHHVDRRADIYSLGCTFYQLLVGHPPFPHGTDMQRLMDHQSRKPLPLQKLRRNIPTELAELCHAMLIKESRWRIHSARVVADRLRKWLLADAASTFPFRKKKVHQPHALGDTMDGFGQVATFMDLPRERKAES